MAAGESGDTANRAAAAAGGGPPPAGASDPDGAAGAGSQAGASGQGSAPDPLTDGVRAAFDLGWTMAGLANDATADAALAVFERLLPSEHELPRLARARLETVRLGCLLTTIDTSITAGGEAPPTIELQTLQVGLEAEEPKWAGVADYLKALHLGVLGYLACLGRPILLAYQLGRSLHDTILQPAQAHADELHGQPRQTGQELPQTSDALQGAFERGRIAAIQEWLAILAPHFPDQSASVVKASVGRWSDWTTAALVNGEPGKLKGNPDKRGAVIDRAANALLSQGDVWLNILVGTRSLAGLLTPEAQVAAGEQAIRRSALIIRRVAWHYWAAILAVALAAVGLTWWSGATLGGAGKVWTQIATIAAGLGVTAKGIGTRVARLADAGEKPIYRAASLDALAWAITTLPDAQLSIRGVHALRRAGIPGSVPLGRA